MRDSTWQWSHRHPTDQSVTPHARPKAPLVLLLPSRRCSVELHVMNSACRPICYCHHQPDERNSVDAGCHVMPADQVEPIASACARDRRRVILRSPPGGVTCASLAKSTHDRAQQRQLLLMTVSARMCRGLSVCDMHTALILMTDRSQ